jgi:hypothetical protein
LCSLLFVDRGERDRGIKKTKKKNKNDVVYLVFFFWVNWSYFIMSLLYWGHILEVLSFYGKNLWALFFFLKKVGLIKFFLGPYFRGLKFV